LKSVTVWLSASWNNCLTEWTMKYFAHVIYPSYWYISLEYAWLLVEVCKTRMLGGHQVWVCQATMTNSEFVKKFGIVMGNVTNSICEHLYKLVNKWSWSLLYLLFIACTGRLKMRDWNYRHHRKCRGGKCRTGNIGTKLQGWKMWDWNYRHHIAGGGKCGTKQLWKAKTPAGLELSLLLVVFFVSSCQAMV